MKYAEINKQYTEAIANYLKQGYVINTSTQSGSYSNEIAHCDLTDGKELIRVVLMNFYDDNFRPSAAGISLQVLSMQLDRPTLKDFKPNQKHGTHDLWNENSTVISKKEWYCIRRESEVCVNGEYKGYSDGWWVTKEELKNQRDVMWTRKYAEYPSSYVVTFYAFAKARLLAYKFVKRQPRCKTVKPGDIEGVERSFINGKNEYIIRAKGKEWTLH